MKSFRCLICALLVASLFTACVPLNEESAVSVDPQVSDTSQDSSSSQDKENDGAKRVYISCTQEINKDVYVNARVRIVDPSGKYETIDDSEAEIKVRGNSTSSAPKKPYNIRLTESTSVFGMGGSKKWCLLSNPYDKTLMRNKLSYDMADAMGMSYVSESEYVDLYVNGSYRGNYLLVESVGVGKDRVDIDIEDNDFLFEYEPWPEYSNPSSFYTPVCNILLGFNDRTEPTPQQLRYAEDFFAELEGFLVAGDYSASSELMDMRSFVDFYIVNELFKNVDMGTSSTRYYLRDGVLYAGPVWDLDLSAGNCSASYYEDYNNVGGSGDSTEGIYAAAQWYPLLFEMPEFVSALYERYLELQPLIVNLTTDNELGVNRIDRLIDKYGESFESNYRQGRWKIDVVYSDLERIPDPTFEENVEYMRDWLIRRNEWLLEHWGLA